MLRLYRRWHAASLWRRRSAERAFLNDWVLNVDGNPTTDAKKGCYGYGGADGRRKGNPVGTSWWKCSARALWGLILLFEIASFLTAAGAPGCGAVPVGDGRDGFCCGWVDVHADDRSTCGRPGGCLPGYQSQVLQQACLADGIPMDWNLDASIHTLEYMRS